MLVQRCPRCHLTLTVRMRSLIVDYCPRCIAVAHLATPMSRVARVTAPPATELRLSAPQRSARRPDMGGDSAAAA